MSGPARSPRMVEEIVILASTPVETPILDAILLNGVVGEVVRATEIEAAHEEALRMDEELMPVCGFCGMRHW